MNRLHEGYNFALIADAGTPLICDPGYLLVKKCREANVKIVALPGACALITALSVSGLPTNEFYFLGFLPRSSKARCTKLTLLKNFTGTIIAYESPHRLIDSLTDIAKVFPPEHKMVCAKELTKQHESVITGTANEIIAWLKEDERRQKGEFVLLIPTDNVTSNEEDDTVILEVKKVVRILQEEMHLSSAAKLASKICNVDKNKLYNSMLANKRHRFSS
ncbi:MAG: 16S rRNA (cytidine(1402)-2'-O)-methyltransferase [Thiotrichales bacterium]|nr:MAG: 16S rRNA (cytidine(1402)-2'-O)-methyltransferase [Thiotrichales bacterium]